MDTPPMQGFQKPLSSGKTQPVRLAVVSYVEGGGATCSCGWLGRHSRAKVLEDKIDVHLAKKHGNRGIRV